MAVGQRGRDENVQRAALTLQEATLLVNKLLAQMQVICPLEAENMHYTSKHQQKHHKRTVMSPNGSVGTVANNTILANAQSLPLCTEAVEGGIVMPDVCKYSVPDEPTHHLRQVNNDDLCSSSDSDIFSIQGIRTKHTKMHGGLESFSEYLVRRL